MITIKNIHKYKGNRRLTDREVAQLASNIRKNLLYRNGIICEINVK